MQDVINDTGLPLCASPISTMRIQIQNATQPCTTLLVAAAGHSMHSGRNAYILFLNASLGKQRIVGVLAKCCSLCRVLFCIYGEPYGLVQASSSPLSPLQSRHASAALSENLGAGCDMSRAVSAKPFSIQHSVDMHKVAYPQQHALPWLQVSEPSACQHGKADAVSDHSPQTQQEDKEGQLQLGKRTPLKTPFSGQEKPSSPQNWAFQPSEKQGMSLLDM